MAQPYYQRDVRPAQAQTVHADERRHIGLLVTGGALLMLAAIAWVFTRQQMVESPLPQAAPAARTASSDASALGTVASETFKAPAPIRMAAAQPQGQAQVRAVQVLQAVTPAPVAAPIAAKIQGTSAPADAAPAMPSSEDVAATGDTRIVQP